VDLKQGDNSIEFASANAAVQALPDPSMQAVHQLAAALAHRPPPRA
jgi:hypothetical protein